MFVLSWNVYHRSSLSFPTIENWAAEHYTGYRDSHGDDPKSGRPIAAQNEEMVANVEFIVMKDC